MSYTRGWPYGPGRKSPGGRARAASAKIALAQRMDLLAEVPLFEGLSKQHLRVIARAVTVRTFVEGARIVTEGSKGGSCFIVVDGSAEVYKGDRPIAKVGSGDVVGEIALFDTVPRTATVMAVTELVALQLSRSDLFDALLEDPKIALRMLEIMARRLRETTDSAG